MIDLFLSVCKRTVLCSLLFFPRGSAIRNLAAMQETQETQFRSLGQEDPLEEEMATHSSIFTGKIPQTEEPGGLQSKGSKKTQLSAAQHSH